MTNQGLAHFERMRSPSRLFIKNQNCWLTDSHRFTTNRIICCFFLLRFASVAGGNNIPLINRIRKARSIIFF